jgi:hypothetical protein
VITVVIHRSSQAICSSRWGSVPMATRTLRRCSTAVFSAIQEDCPRDPGHEELDEDHGRIIRRSIWVTDAGDIDFPHVSRVARIRRDGYDSDGTLISKEIVHAVTSLDAGRASAAGLAELARGQRGIESVHWPRSPGTGLAVASCGADATRVSFSF